MLYHKRVQTGRFPLRIFVFFVFFVVKKINHGEHRGHKDSQRMKRAVSTRFQYISASDMPRASSLSQSVDKFEIQVAAFR